MKIDTILIHYYYCVSNENCVQLKNMNYALKAELFTSFRSLVFLFFNSQYLIVILHFYLSK